jgi:hypothetical protein
MLNKQKEQKTQKDETGTLVNQSYPISTEHWIQFHCQLVTIRTILLIKSPERKKEERKKKEEEEKEKERKIIF